MIQKFVQQLKESVQESLDGVHTCIPGEIVSFNARQMYCHCKADRQNLKRPDGQKVSTHKSQRFRYTSSKAARRKALHLFSCKTGGTGACSSFLSRR